MDLLKNKTALVTGASRGIGRGIAIQLASAGANLIVAHFPSSTDYENAQMVAGEIRTLGREAVAVPMDVTDKVSIQQGLAAIPRRMSEIDILVNNAGVMQRCIGMETNEADFDRCYEVNVKGVWSVTQELLPQLMLRGAGRIINISSGAGRKGSPDLPAYCASKAALISLTQSLASALGQYNINVNAVCPGFIHSDMCEEFLQLVKRQTRESEPAAEDALKQFASVTPLRRIQSAEDVASAVLFLASSHSKNITGQALNVDGGYFMN